MQSVLEFVIAWFSLVFSYQVGGLACLQAGKLYFAKLTRPLPTNVIVSISVPFCRETWQLST